MTSGQKTIKYVAIGLAIFLCVGIIGGIVSMVTAMFGLFGGENEVGPTWTYEAGEDVKKLEIELGATRLILEEGDTFFIESNNKAVKVEEKNGVLRIKEKNWFWNNYRGQVLRVYLPAGIQFDEVNIETGAGTVHMDCLSARRLKLDLGAGKVDIDCLTATEWAKVDGGAGQITIGSGSLANLDLDMGVGELRLTSRLTGNSDLDMGVGAARIVLLGSSEDYRISVQKGIGEARVDGNPASTGSVYGSGTNHVQIDGGVGSIRVSFEEER